METLEQIALEVGLLDHSSGKLSVGYVENNNFQVYYYDANPGEEEVIEVVKKVGLGSKFYIQKDIPKLVLFLENNNFLNELI